MKNKSSAVTGLTGGIEYLFKKNKVDYVKGWGKFKDANTIVSDLIAGGTSELTAKNIILATGSEPSSLPAGMLDIDEKFVITSDGALNLTRIPKKMITIGGGVIGLEMSQVYQRLGAEVTVVQPTSHVCPFLDTEIAKSFQKILKK
jgi:dihydrolipoamide dehydrogenase